MTERPSKAVKFSDLRIRLLSGIALAAISYICIRLGGVWAALLVAALLVLMQWEYRRIITGEDATLSPALLVMVVSNLAALGLILAGGAFAGLAAALAGAVVSAIMSRGHFWGIALGGAYIAVAMCVLLIFRERVPEGFLLILWLVLVVIACDVGAFFVGRSIGGAKLWPSVSPGKTRSGAIGGLVIAGAVALLTALALGWNPLISAILGLFVAAGAQLGDLIESAVKRHHGVKDSSGLIPGHGGFLDRFDGMIGGTWVFLAFDSAGIALAGP